MTEIGIFALFMLVVIALIVLISIAVNPETRAKVRFPFGAGFEFQGRRSKTPPKPLPLRPQPNQPQPQAQSTTQSSVWLAIKQHGHADWTYSLDPRTQVYIGRKPDNQVHLAHDSEADLRHAVIYFENKRYYLNNLSSKGTRINNRSVTKQVLGNGNIIVIGRTRIIFREEHK